MDNLLGLVIVIGAVALIGFLMFGQSPIARRVRRIFQQQRQPDAKIEPIGERPAPIWEDDPDQVNEAREVERITGVIRAGDAFTVETADPSHWGARSFEIEGTVTGVAEAQTVDASGNFQFRFLTVNTTGTRPNTLIVEGDAPTTAVVYLGYAYTLQDSIEGTSVGSIVSHLVDERNRYRMRGLPELPTELPVYGAGAITAARYEGRCALLESQPGSSYLPASAQGSQGQPYSDLTVRLDGSGWMVRLMELGSYTYLIEMEPLRLSNLTIHHA